MRLRRKSSEATGRSHAYNQADEWASQLCNKESLSATDRSTRYRQRKRALAAGKVPIPRLVAGRKPISGYASSNTAKRRRQRARLAARTNLAEYLAHFRRLRVILKTSLNTCSDFRRMARLSAGLTRAKASATQRTAILLCDRCWRDARISRKLLERFSAAKGQESGSPCARALHAICAVKNSHLTKSLNHHAYWQETAAIITQSQVECMKPEDVECIARLVVKAARTGNLRIDATALRMVSKIQFVKWRSLISYLRVC